MLLLLNQSNTDSDSFLKCTEEVIQITTSNSDCIII